MKIELKSLDLVHFKCFPKLHLDFHEGVNSLFGANAAGKTSVYDALTWLLFDKDSAGHSRPAIKPTGAPAGTMPEVTAILEVDGEPIKLRKVLREKWEKPRGSSIERYAGDTRDYSITLAMSHDKVAMLLPDGTPWSIVQRTPAPDGSGTENENEWDNSAYSLSGDITDHRDGTVTIKMGKPTDLEDAYEMLLGGDEA